VVANRQHGVRQS
jgi:putative transposase